METVSILLQACIPRLSLPVKMTAIHLCHLHPRLWITKPQIKGPRVFPPEIAFLELTQHPSSHAQS